MTQCGAGSQRLFTPAVFLLLCHGYIFASPNGIWFTLMQIRTASRFRRQRTSMRTRQEEIQPAAWQLSRGMSSFWLQFPIQLFRSKFQTLVNFLSTLLPLFFLAHLPKDFNGMCFFRVQFFCQKKKFFIPEKLNFFLSKKSCFYSRKFFSAKKFFFFARKNLIFLFQSKGFFC